MIQFSEVIQLKDSVLSRIDYHQRRVNRTAQDFHLQPVDLSVLHSQIPENARQYGHFKCRVIYSDRIETVEWIPYSFRKIRKIGVVVNDNIDYSYKYVDRQSIQKLLESSGCDDIIIVKNGWVSDSSSANLVFKSAAGLFTPKHCLLPGTKRQYLLDCGKITEKPISIHDIETFVQVFFINAMIDLEDRIGEEACIVAL